MRRVFLDKIPQAKCRVKTLKSPGSNLHAPIRQANRKFCTRLSQIPICRLTQRNPHLYIYKWGFGRVDKAQCFRSASLTGAEGLSPDFSRVFHDTWLLGICLDKRRCSFPAKCAGLMEVNTRNWRTTVVSLLKVSCKCNHQARGKHPVRLMAVFACNFKLRNKLV